MVLCHAGMHARVRAADLVNILEDAPLVAPPRGNVIDGGAAASLRRLHELPAIHTRVLQDIGLQPLKGSLYAQQWGLPNVNATGAWSITSGVPDVVVAVIDTGCDLTHPDLKANLWVNKGEIPNNGRDDDGNGTRRVAAHARACMDGLHSAAPVP